MGQAVQPTPAGSEFHYERRRPEDTTLYQLVQEHLESFLALVEAQTGASLPDPWRPPKIPHLWPPQIPPPLERL